MSPPRKKYAVTKKIFKLLSDSYLEYLKSVCLDLEIQPLSSDHVFLTTVSKQWKELLETVRLHEDNLVEIALDIQRFIFELKISWENYIDYVMETLKESGADPAVNHELVLALSTEEYVNELEGGGLFRLQTFIFQVEQLAFGLYDYIFGYGTHKNIVTYYFDGKMDCMQLPTDKDNLFFKAGSSENRIVKSKEYKFKNKEYKKKYSSIIAYKEVVDKGSPFLLFFIGVNKIGDGLNAREKSYFYYVDAPSMGVEEAVEECIVHFMQSELETESYLPPRPVGLDKL
jgi:hypothetical protein